MRYSAHGGRDAPGSEHPGSGGVEDTTGGHARATALARERDRAPEAADRQAAADAVRPPLGESPAADRAAGAAAGRPGGEEGPADQPGPEPASCPSRCQPSYSLEAIAASACRTPATRDPDL